MVLPEEVVEVAVREFDASSLVRATSVCSPSLSSRCPEGPLTGALSAGRRMAAAKAYHGALTPDATQPAATH